MNTKRTVIATLFAAGLAVLPLSAGNAQYYYPCNPFPLTWPFCIAGAAVGTAAAIATAPFRPYYYPYYYRPYYGPAYYYYRPWRHHRWRHRRWH